MCCLSRDEHPASAHHVSQYYSSGHAVRISNVRRRYAESKFRRKRAIGIRPRTFNFYCKFQISPHVVVNLAAFTDWLPNHLLVIHVLLLFSVLNPFVLPFATLYFFTQVGQSLVMTRY